MRDFPHDLDEQASREPHSEPADFASNDEPSGGGPSTMDRQSSKAEIIEAYRKWDYMCYDDHRTAPVGVDGLRIFGKEGWELVTTQDLVANWDGVSAPPAKAEIFTRYIFKRPLR